MKSRQSSDAVSGAYVNFQMAGLKALPRDLSEKDLLFWTRNGELLAYALNRAFKFEATREVLTEKSCVGIPAIGRFAVGDVFRPRGQICHLDERFIARFLKKIEDPTAAVAVVSYAAEVAYEAAIILELGWGCQMTLGQLWYFISNQGNGEDGFLLNGGEMNTVYAFDCSGVLTPVSVYWNSSRSGWHVQCSPHNLTCGMLADARQILSPAA